MNRNLILIGLVCLAGCMEGTKPTPLAHQSLHSRLGGQELKAKLSPLVDRWITRVADDQRLPERLRKPFQDQDSSGLRDKVLGGIEDLARKEKPVSPEEQQDAVRRLGLTEKEYQALREDFEQAMADPKGEKEETPLGGAEREELLEMLAPVLADLLGRQD